MAAIRAACAGRRCGGQPVTGDARIFAAPQRFQEPRSGCRPPPGLSRLSCAASRFSGRQVTLVPWPAFDQSAVAAGSVLATDMLPARQAAEHGHILSADRLLGHLDVIIVVPVQRAKMSSYPGRTFQLA